MTTASEFRVGDVVDVGGMRGIIKEERNGRFRVGAGRTDEGIWVDVVDMVFVYREPTPRTQEEKVAFRKDWDRRVEEGKARANDDAD